MSTEAPARSELEELERLRRAAQVFVQNMPGLSKDLRVEIFDNVDDVFVKVINKVRMKQKP